MLKKYFIIFNGQTNLDNGVLIKNRVAKHSPTMRYEEIEIPGRDGLLYKKKGYGDIDITIPFNFVSKSPNAWDYDFRKVKKWINSFDDNKLKFSDDVEYFYKVKKVTIDTPERVLKKIGRFNVIFTCEPYIYLYTGEEELDLEKFIYNDGEVSRPTFLIKGEGVLNLTVNGNLVKINVGQNLKIDTSLGLCYRENGTMNNSAITGYYESLYLQEGENNFDWNGNFDIKIMPNWRYL